MILKIIIYLYNLYIYIYIFRQVNTSEFRSTLSFSARVHNVRRSWKGSFHLRWCHNSGGVPATANLASLHWAMCPVSHPAHGNGTPPEGSGEHSLGSPVVVRLHSVVPRPVL